MDNKKEKKVAPEENREQGVSVSDELRVCKEELLGWKEKFRYVSADLDNFRRRMEKERIQWMQVAQAGLIKDLLPILDNFDRAVQQHNKQELSKEMREWLSGFLMIGSSLDKVLKAAGLQEITQTKTFDPELHEAIAQVESSDHESGAIVELLQKGYLFRDQVIRPARVSVAK